MKKFVVSGMSLCMKMSGIPRYTYEIVKRLDDRIEGLDIVIFLCYPTNETMKICDLKNIKMVPLQHGKRKWMLQVIRNFAQKEQAQICDFGMGYCLKRNSITTIHDVRPYLKKYDTLKSRIQFWTSILVAKMMHSTIVTVSETQKIAIKKILKKNKVIVIPNGWEHMLNVGEDDSIFERFSIKKGIYFYSLGSVAKHKNIKWVYEVAKRNPNYQFVVAGNVSKESWQIDDKDFDADNIIFTGFVTDEENKSLMKNCKAFLQASLYEGFGIPPLEAISLGVPIAVSGIDVFKEVFGSVATFFGVNEYDFDLESIKPVSKEKREELLSVYSWERSADDWLKLLQSY